MYKNYKNEIGIKRRRLLCFADDTIRVHTISICESSVIRINIKIQNDLNRLMTGLSSWDLN